MADSSNVSRRGFLRKGLGLVAALPAAALTGGGVALAAERLKESDPAAQALKYVHDASKADDAAYKEGQTCANCQFFEGSKGDQWAPCTIFKGKEVNADGWCKSWVKAS